MITSSICTIGDEILIGQIVDTNSSMISRATGAIGIKTQRMVSIADNHAQIVSELSKELRCSDVVIVTGGLGPTKDDITKAALMELSGAKSMKRDSEQEKIIHEILSSRGLDVLQINLDQALVPDTCQVIPNRKGTAPIMAFHFDESRFGHKCALYSLPGVPFEAEAALPDIINDLKENFNTEQIYHKTLMVYGIAESALSELISDWEDKLPECMHLAYLPNPMTGIRLRLSIYGCDAILAESMVQEQISSLKPLLGNMLYAECDSSLEKEIGKLLSVRGETLSTAESCTGGMIAHMITSVSGSSNYFLGSVVSYAISVKTRTLGVDPAVIKEKGVVSAEVADQMANGVRNLTSSTYSIATTGLAEGSDQTNPEGTVWIAVSGPRGTVREKFRYKNDRKRNIERFSASALDLLRRSITEGKI